MRGPVAVSTVAIVEDVTEHPHGPITEIARLVGGDVQRLGQPPFTVLCGGSA